PAAAKVVYRAWELGLVLYDAGNWSNVLEITPQLILSRAEIDEGAALLDQAFLQGRAGGEGQRRGGRPLRGLVGGQGERSDRRVPGGATPGVPA
ncbi:MAG: hypothetical protein QJR03_11500, partial [Sphaerobacter sp.]|nr:hypothetical protein [Sphaerobacter sp.]